jgi:hypothetical protein
MAMMITGLFQQLAAAQRAAQALTASGLAAEQVRVMQSENHGGAMVMVHGDEAALAQAHDVLRRHGAADVSPQGAARSYSPQEIHEYLMRGTFATGQTDAVLVEASNEHEGTFATGQAAPDAVTSNALPADTTPVEEETKGSFATGQEEGQQEVISNQPEGSFGEGQGTKQ